MADPPDRPHCYSHGQEGQFYLTGAEEQDDGVEDGAGVFPEHAGHKVGRRVVGGAGVVGDPPHHSPEPLLRVYPDGGEKGHVSKGGGDEPDGEGEKDVVDYGTSYGSGSAERGLQEVDCEDKAGEGEEEESGGFDQHGDPAQPTGEEEPSTLALAAVEEHSQCREEHQRRHPCVQVEDLRLGQVVGAEGQEEAGHGRGGTVE